MKKYLVLIIVAISLVVSFGIISNIAARENQPATVAADNRSILTLSYTELFIPCKIGYVPTKSCPDINSIYVGVRGNQNPDDGTESEIKYKVSGGRIIGEGSLVKWDFSEVRKAGNYIITVEFSDFENKKHTATETITLRDCDCPNDELSKENTTPKIEQLELDRTELVIPCPPLPEGYPKRADSPCYNETGIINVKTIVDNPQNTPLTYQYKISGGRIVGEGETVVWDLKNARPGTYRISAAIADSRGVITETDAQEIEINDRCCCLFCVCPTLEITSDETLNAGETVTFTAKVSGGSDTSGLTYKWTVSQGEIIAGQGTEKITLKTTKEMSGTIEATVEISAPGLCSVCSLLTESETVTIIQ